MRLLLILSLAACTPTAPPEPQASEPEEPPEPEPLPRSVIANVKASSHLVEERESFPAAHAVDGDPATAWCEGVDGLGDGESITITLHQPTELSMIAIDSGFFRDDRTLRNNGRPRKIRVTSDTGWDHLVTFGYIPERKHKATEVRVRPTKLMEPGKARVMTFTLVESDKGQFTEDVCISRIQLFGT